MLPTSDLRRVRLNVGGQVFETSVRVLRRDPDSLLAALASEDAPLELDDATLRAAVMAAGRLRRHSRTRRSSTWRRPRWPR